MEATVEKAGAGQFGRRFKDVARCIGARIRERRMMLGITQQELAEIAGVTYQQMHKYETSTNHIFAGRLHTLAQALGVDIDYFYQDMTAGSSTLEQPASRRRWRLTALRRATSTRRWSATATSAGTTAGASRRIDYVRCPMRIL